MWPTTYPACHGGTTAVAMVTLLRRKLPAVSQWFCWRPSQLSGHNPLGAVVAKTEGSTGGFMGWSWSTNSAYPFVPFLSGGNCHDQAWTGVIAVRGPAAAQFYLCSYLNADGVLGHEYLASTRDIKLLEMFARDLALSGAADDSIRIHTPSGDDILLPSCSQEKLFLPDAMLKDIEEQVFSFFENPDLYRKLRIPYRRGFLFVGGPGNGKTMMMRQLVRKCSLKYRASASLLEVSAISWDSELKNYFKQVALRTPGILLVDELDSVCHDTMVTRMGLLSQLDGFRSSEGLLILGATNDPGGIDPALIHRPSRFDRVWQFPAPTLVMRRAYLGWAFEQLDEHDRQFLARDTEGWSYAYLNELRTTAAILAASRHCDTPTLDDVQQAFEFLAVQCRSGQKKHWGEEAAVVGFQ